MSSKYKFHSDYQPYFITCTVVGWADVFTREQYRTIILDSLHYCSKNKGLILHAWVIMSNHLHLIASPAPGCHLSDIVRDFKKFTSKAIVTAIQNSIQESRSKWLLDLFAFVGRGNPNNQQYQFWKQDSHPVLLDTREKFTDRMRYLHENPLRAGLVWECAQYRYSSAIDYYEGKEGLLPVALLNS